MASLQTQAVVANIIDVLAPYLGETMARASTRSHCEKLGIRNDMSADQAEILVAKLAAGLRVFLPKEKCLLVVDRLRRTVGQIRPT